MPDISLDTREFQKAMREVTRETGRTMDFVLHDIMALWVKDLIKWTMPKSLKQGRARVVQDLRNIFFPLDNEAALTTWTEDVGATGEMWRKGKGGVFKLSKQFMALSESKMAPFHKAHRDRRGRTRSQRRASEAWGGRMVVPGSVFKKYSAKIQKKVGFTKGGWVRAASALGVKVPSWIRRHGNAPGSWRDELRGLKGFLLASNNVPWVRDIGGMMDRALQKRYRDLRSGKYVERWRKTIAKHSAH